MSKKKGSKFQVEAEIKEINCIKDNCLITVYSPDISDVAKPGQFVMVKTTDQSINDPLIRRPFSIHQATGNEFSFVFKIVGRGTKLLADKKKSESLSIVGPLGNNFTVAEKGNHYLVGGGMGIAPLYFLAEHVKKISPKKNIVAMLGSRTAQEFKIFSNFLNIEGIPLKISTDDGSTGHHGLVLDLLEETVAEEGEGTVYCCGPFPMMQAIAKFCKDKKMNCQASLETIMACGIGACLGCAVAGSDIMRHDYIHVCKDGPVFEADKIWM